jgi:hypothetical protein
MAEGKDTYVLWEINASSTFAFPEFAMPAVAEAALAQIADAHRLQLAQYRGDPDSCRIHGRNP